MSGDSLPIALPFSGFATEAREVTVLYREVRKPLLRYLMCLGISTDEAQDVVQDVFLALHRHLASGGSQANIRSWLFRVAHNQARNRQNRYDRRFGTPLDEAIDAMLDEATPERAVLQKDKVPAAGKGDPPTSGIGARVPPAARQWIALSGNRRGLRNSNLHRGRYGGSSDQEISGEMQCVTFREN